MANKAKGRVISDLTVTSYSMDDMPVGSIGVINDKCAPEADQGNIVYRVSGGVWADLSELGPGEVWDGTCGGNFNVDILPEGTKIEITVG